MCKFEWYMVLAEHDTPLSSKQWMENSLKRKFAELHCKEMQSGGPRILADVRRDQHIIHQISERADIGDAEKDNAIAADT